MGPTDPACQIDRLIREVTAFQPLINQIRAAIQNKCFDIKMYEHKSTNSEFKAHFSFQYKKSHIYNSNELSPTERAEIFPKGNHHKRSCGLSAQINRTCDLIGYIEYKILLRARATITEAIDTYCDPNNLDRAKTDLIEYEVLKKDFAKNHMLFLIQICLVTFDKIEMQCNPFTDDFKAQPLKAVLNHGKTYEKFSALKRLFDFSLTKECSFLILTKMDAMFS